MHHRLNGFSQTPTVLEQNPVDLKIKVTFLLQNMTVQIVCQILSSFVIKFGKYYLIYSEKKAQFIPA